METFSALLALWEGNPPVTDGFTLQRPMMQSFNIFLGVHLKNGQSYHIRVSSIPTTVFVSQPVTACNDLMKIELVAYKYLVEAVARDANPKN